MTEDAEDQNERCGRLLAQLSAIPRDYGNRASGCKTLAIHFDLVGQPQLAASLDTSTMLVPDTIQAAATAADAEVVLAWLDAGNDVNSNGGSYSYNLLTATAMATPIAEANVALARELLRRGADPRLGNNHSYGQWVPLHAAARGQGPASAEMVALLLDAGADPDALMDNESVRRGGAVPEGSRGGRLRTCGEPPSYFGSYVLAHRWITARRKRTRRRRGGWYSAEEVPRRLARKDGAISRIRPRFHRGRTRGLPPPEAGEYVILARRQVATSKTCCARVAARCWGQRRTS